jgi:hypothetical protein
VHTDRHRGAAKPQASHQFGVSKRHEVNSSVFPAAEIAVYRLRPATSRLMPHDSQPPREACATPSLAAVDAAVEIAVLESDANPHPPPDPQPPDPQPIPHS